MFKTNIYNRLGDLKPVVAVTHSKKPDCKSWLVISTKGMAGTWWDYTLTRIEINKSVQEQLDQGMPVSLIDFDSYIEIAVSDEFEMALLLITFGNNLNDFNEPEKVNFPSQLIW